MSIARFIQEKILGPDWRPTPKPPIVVTEKDVLADAANLYFGWPAPMRLFTPYTKAGRCLEGERDHGHVVHLVRGWKALCGTSPGQRSAGWSSYPSEKATCPRCLKSRKRLEDWPPYTLAESIEFTAITSRCAIVTEVSA
jgi:hypothetical protein